MPTLTLTLQSDSPLSGSLDLELPADVPIIQLVGILLDVLQLPRVDGLGQPIGYRLIKLPSREPLSPQSTLDAAGIVTGRVLALLPAAAGVAAIRTASGRVFPLDDRSKPYYVLGRSDAAQQPDIDFTYEPGGQTVSRLHAQVYRQGAQWMVVQIAPNNSTWVNQTQLLPNQPYPLAHGNVITLGQAQVTFNFA